MNDITVYVPARLNSERLPQKVFRDFNGKPLFLVILNELKQSKTIKNFYLNTDSLMLIEMAKKNKYKYYLRNSLLAQNSTSTEEILADFAKNCNTKYIAVINPTNPLLKAETIDHFINEAIEKNYDTAFSVSLLRKHCLINSIPINYSTFGPHPRTQDVIPIQYLNWAIVLWKTDLVKNKILQKGDSLYLGKVGFIEIPELDAYDIDTLSDFLIAESLHKLLNANT